MLIKILWPRSGYKDVQRSVQFVMSKSSVIMADIKSKFKSPLHLERTPMLGWSYPEAEIATWMSYDTEIQKHLLKKLLITYTRRTRIKKNLQFNWKCQTITFRILNGSGKTLLPMNPNTDTRSNLVCNHRDRETDGAMHWKLILPKLIITLRRDGKP